MNKNVCQISIVVPFYNVELYFRDFLCSLLPINNNYEVILIDDGSKDSSIDIAIDFTSRFDNVALYRKENGGLSSARNYGLQFVKGEYVVFFDSDDYIEDKTAITKMFETAVNNNSDIVVAPYYEFVNLDRKKFRFDKLNFHNDLISLEDKMNKLFKNDISLAVWDKMYKLDFLKQNSLQFKEGVWFEDLDFIFRSFYFANKISKIDSVLIGYRQRPESIMKTVSPKILDKAYVMDGLFAFLEANNKIDAFYENFKILYVKMIFSIIHSVLINRGDQVVKQNILDNVFDLTFFNTVIRENLMLKKDLSNLEKILFFLIKYKIINRNNVSLIRYFNILRKL
jgi:glycosyltransferase involved in cell wall biosynthesis